MLKDLEILSLEADLPTDLSHKLSELRLLNGTLPDKKWCRRDLKGFAGCHQDFYAVLFRKGRRSGTWSLLWIVMWSPSFIDAECFRKAFNLHEDFTLFTLMDDFGLCILLTGFLLAGSWFVPFSELNLEAGTTSGRSCGNEYQLILRDDVNCYL